ncbi:hypothetical protein ACFL0V_06540, partial [Nanoarchaeota archaeon]
MKKNAVYNIAMFMIFLVVMLPIYSSASMAATINPPIIAKGKAEVPGFRAVKDMMTISVSVTHPEDADLGEGQVKYLEDPVRKFTCEKTDETTVTSMCVNEYPEQEVSGEDALSFTVGVYGDGGNPISTPVEGIIYVDSIPPEVTIAKYTPGKAGVVTVNYVLTDKACEAVECQDKCSGLAGLEFTVGEIKVGEANMTPLCSMQGKIDLEGVIGGGGVDTKHICAEVTDRIGLSSSKCQDVLADAKEPEVTSVSLMDGAGRIIKHTNGQPLGSVRLIVN